MVMMMRVMGKTIIKIVQPHVRGIRTSSKSDSHRCNAATPTNGKVFEDDTREKKKT